MRGESDNRRRWEGGRGSGGGDSGFRIGGVEGSGRDWGEGGSVRELGRWRDQERGNERWKVVGKRGKSTEEKRRHLEGEKMYGGGSSRLKGIS